MWKFDVAVITFIFGVDFLVLIILLIIMTSRKESDTAIKPYTECKDCKELITKLTITKSQLKLQQIGLESSRR